MSRIKFSREFKEVEQSLTDELWQHIYTAAISSGSAVAQALHAADSGAREYLKRYFNRTGK